MQTAQVEYDFAQPALTRRTHDNGTVETFGFDAAGHMTAMAGTQLQFDAPGGSCAARCRTARSRRWCTTIAAHRAAKRVTVAGHDRDALRRRSVRRPSHVGTGYVFAAGRLVARIRGSGRRHLHVDRRGSVVLVTRTDGGVDRARLVRPVRQRAADR